MTDKETIKETVANFTELLKEAVSSETAQKIIVNMVSISFIVFVISQ